MPEGLRVDNRLVIPEGELTERFMPSGGPGGQHANRASTRVELRFDVLSSPTLGESQRARLLEHLGSEVRVVVDDERSQSRNRELARERLAGRIRNALAVQPRRRPTRPTRGSKQRRLDAKRRRSELKAQRRRPPQ